jgi:restriction endonuclease S subunit
MNEALQSAYFKNRTRGTSLLSLQRSAVEEYRIPIPPLHHQQNIIHLYREYLKQENLHKAIQEKKKKLLQ